MTTINYRTALTSGALALALLLSGCSADETNPKKDEAASSASASEISSEQPDQSKNNKDSEKTSDSPSGESSTSTSNEKKYSGGSKAPEGEYRPADEHGPAQNVPEPKIPEGMDVESSEGLVKFVQYWNETRNYAVETGDTSLVRERTSLEYKKGISNFDTWDNLRLKDGWNIGGLQEIGVDKSQLQSLGDGYYAAPLKVRSQDAITAVNGEYISHKLSKQNENAYIIKLQYADNEKWYLIDIKKFEG